MRAKWQANAVQGTSIKASPKEAPQRNNDRDAAKAHLNVALRHAMRGHTARQHPSCSGDDNGPATVGGSDHPCRTAEATPPLPTSATTINDIAMIPCIGTPVSLCSMDSMIEPHPTPDNPVMRPVVAPAAPKTTVAERDHTWRPVLGFILPTRNCDSVARAVPLHRACRSILTATMSMTA